MLAAALADAMIIVYMLGGLLVHGAGGGPVEAAAAESTLARRTIEAAGRRLEALDFSGAAALYGAACAAEPEAAAAGLLDCAEAPKALECLARLSQSPQTAAGRRTHARAAVRSVSTVLELLALLRRAPSRNLQMH